MADADEVAIEMFVLCERCTIDADEKPSLHGTFSRIFVPAFPATHDVFVAVVELWAPPFATVPLWFRLEGPPGSVKYPPMGPMEVPVGASGIACFGSTLEQTPFYGEGVHSISVVHEGQVLARRRFTVEQRPEPELPLG